MKKLIFLFLVFLSLKGFSQDTALSTLGKYIPVNQLSLLHPLIAIDPTHAGMDTARYYLSTFAYNGTNDSLVITFLDGTRMAVAKPSGGGGGTGSAWKTVNTNDITDTLNGNVAIGNGISTPLAKLQINISGINATQPDSSKGIYLVNPDASTSGNQKFSPGMWWAGTNWRNGVSASGKVGVNAYLKTVQGNTQSVGYLTFGWQGQSGGFKPDLLTIGAFGDGYGWGVGIGTSAPNTSGAILNIGGTVNQISGNYSVASTWNLNVSGNPFLDFKNGLLRFGYGVVSGILSPMPIAVGRNDSTDLGAQLSVTSTGRGFLFPRMTTIQRDSINLQITGINIVNGGTGYTVGPFLAPSAGPTPAVATTSLTSSVTWIISGGVITGYSGYSHTGGSYNNTPTFTITGGNGTGFAASPIMTQFLTPGMTIYNTTVNKMQTWDGSTWQNAW